MPKWADLLGSYRLEKEVLRIDFLFSRYHDNYGDSFYEEHVAIEAENDSRSIGKELRHLRMLRVPIKVLITSGKSEDAWALQCRDGIPNVLYRECTWGWQSAVSRLNKNLTEDFYLFLHLVWDWRLGRVDVYSLALDHQASMLKPFSCIGGVHFE